MKPMPIVVSMNMPANTAISTGPMPTVKAQISAPIVPPIISAKEM